MPRHSYFQPDEEYSLPGYYTIPDNYTLPEECRPGVGEHTVIPEEHTTTPEDGPRGQKRKRESEGDWERVDLTPQQGRIYGTVSPEMLIEIWLDRQPTAMANPGHELRIDIPISIPKSKASEQVQHTTTPPDQPLIQIDHQESPSKLIADTDQKGMGQEDVNQENIDHNIDQDGTDERSYNSSDIIFSQPRIPRCLESDYDPDEFEHASSLGAYMPLSNSGGFNSIRPPDPFVISESMPYDPTIIAPSLYRPRSPPILPPHILALPFKSILKRYNRLTKVIDDYQRWHGREVFGFWMEKDVALAKSGEVPELAKAFNGDRPSVPPFILNTQFDVILLSSPLLSHLIERYHKDLGFNYFGFYRYDPRDYPNDIDDDSSVSSS
ncbi:hypothetical protein GGR51DRAFT_573529 [Nemania sp. FL0031]|nr:hypothetical protein GGR51DRAFT_573529 [Nemania sp. FL0031]